MQEKELRGARYLKGIEDHPFAKEIKRFIAQELPKLDYQPTLDKYEELIQYFSDAACGKDDGERLLAKKCEALLGCNDRYYLLVNLLGREDAKHLWIFDRCREVEADPDGHVDLWARYHFKAVRIQRISAYAVRLASTR